MFKYTEAELRKKSMTLPKLQELAIAEGFVLDGNEKKDDLIDRLLTVQVEPPAGVQGQGPANDEPPIIVQEGMPSAQKFALGAIGIGLLLLAIAVIVLFGMKGCDSSKISEGTYEQESIPADYEPQPIVPGGGRSWADVIRYGDKHPVYWRLVKIVTRGEVDRAYAVKSLEAEQSGRNMLVILHKGTVLTNSEYLKDRDEYRVLRGYRLKKDREALIGYDGKPRVLTMCLNPIDFCEGKPWTPCPDEPQKPKDKPKPRDKPKEPEEPCYVPDDTSEYHTPSNPAYQPPAPIPGKSDPTPGYTPGDAEESPPQGDAGSAPPGDDTNDGATAHPSDPEVIIVTPETDQDNEGPPPPPPPPPPAP